MPTSYSIDGQPPLNIQVDGSDISFVRLNSGQDDAYERGVISLLRQIGQSRTGGIILRAIHRMPQRLVIIPSNVSTESEAIRRDNELLLAFRRIAVDELGRVRASGPGTNPDEILLHELVHIVRMMRTWSNPSSYRFANVGDGFGNIEEFYAVLIANIYSSETARPLRRDHSLTPGGGTRFLFPMINVAGMAIPDRQDGDLFFPQNRNSIELMRDDDIGFGVQIFNELAQIGTDFNPLRELVHFELEPRVPAPAAIPVRGTGAAHPPPGGRGAGIARVTPRRDRH
jgi:hypothetical protein